MQHSHQKLSTRSQRTETTQRIVTTIRISESVETHSIAASGRIFGIAVAMGSRDSAGACNLSHFRFSRAVAFASGFYNVIARFAFICVHPLSPFTLEDDRVAGRDQPIIRFGE
jgi:hypothetical protein